MTNYVDINCDLGEGMTTDAQVIPLITSANVACGWHAGSPEIMRQTVKLAKEYGIRVGAHPGFDDKENFGRTEVIMSAADIEEMTRLQVKALADICAEEGVKLQHVKPHGALYNMASKDIGMAKAICRGIIAVDSSLFMLAPGYSCLAKAAREMGLPVACEVFADRAYEEDGSLVSRKKPGAVITDADIAIERTLKMVCEGSVICASGKEIKLNADSVCIHGDNPSAIEFAGKIRSALEAEGVIIEDFSSFAERRTSIDESIQDIVLRHSARGMDILRKELGENCFEAAAEALLEGPGPVLVLTGFDVGGAAETDGPPGAYAVCKALKAEGIEPVIVAPDICRGFFEETGFMVEYVSVADERPRYEGIIDIYRPSALLSIECLGRNRKGTYLNFRNKDISSITAKLDNLFDLARARGIVTVGIGDGGNEIGMGQMLPVIEEKLGIAACDVPSDILLVATTSNWGAYGLAAAMGHPVRWSDVKAFTEHIVSAGAIDGVSKLPRPTVDGFPVETDRSIVLSLDLKG